MRAISPRAAAGGLLWPSGEGPVVNRVFDVAVYTVGADERAPAGGRVEWTGVNGDESIIGTLPLVERGISLTRYQQLPRILVARSPAAHVVEIDRERIEDRQDDHVGA